MIKEQLLSLAASQERRDLIRPGEEGGGGMFIIVLTGRRFISSGGGVHFCLGGEGMVHHFSLAWVIKLITVSRLGRGRHCF